MTSFHEKIAEKKESDRKLFNESVDTIYLLADKKSKKALYNDDLLSSLESILHYYGLKFPAIPENITDRDQILNYVMTVTGVMRRKITLEKKWWKEASLPLLCTDSSGVITALIPRITGSYIRVDNQTNRSARIGAKEALTIEKSVYCFYRPLKNEKMNVKDLLVNIFSAFTSGDIILFLVISLLIALFGLLLPAINRYIFNDVIPSGSKSDMWGVASLLIGAGTVSVLFAAIRSAWALRIENKAENYIENAVWARVLTLPVSFTKNYEAEDLTQRANAAGELCTILTGSLPPILLSLLFSVMYLFQIGKYSPALLWPSLLILLLLFISIILSGYLSFVNYRDKRRLKTKLSSLTHQLYNGVAKVKLAGAEVRSFSKWAALYAESSKEPALFVIIAGAIYTFIVFGGYILLYSVSIHEKLDPSDFISFNVAFGIMTAAIMQLGIVTGHIARIKPLLEQLRPILEAAPETNFTKANVFSLSGMIEINQLTFGYGEGMPTVLDELSLTIRPGEYIAITGSSGCGKSTLIRLLLGFETPGRGAIYYDNSNLQDLNLRSVRQRIGVVLQDGKLFNDSIYANIVICAPWLSLDEAWEAAELAGLAEDIRAMPMGMFTMISDNGGISGGQKQRVLIARAIANKPDILIFDEATSALDNITQSQIVDTLSRMKITRIVIAHRLSTIRNCDRIIYLDKGRIAESGTFNELMSIDGLFSKMATRQI